MGVGQVYPARQFLPLFPLQPNPQGAAGQSKQAPPAHAAALGRPAPPAFFRGPPSGTAPGTVPEKGSGNDPASQFDIVVYHSQLEKVALSIQLREIAAGLAGADNQQGKLGEASVTDRQLTFDFFAESRSIELAAFQQRTGAVAKGLGQAQSSTYLEAGRQVAARFSMSVSVSGAVLSGFAGASEGLQEADEADFDRFMAFVEEALAQVDDILNRLFELLDGLFKGEGDLTAQFNQFLDGLDIAGLLGLPDGAQPVATGGAQGQSFQFGMQLEFRFEFSELIQIQEAKVKESDPITLDLDGDGIELTRFTEGARFDITGTGRTATTAFVTGGDAFLAIDRNLNGLIDDGTELFGDQRGAVNGFEELRKLDSNGDGVIDRQDPAFAGLVLFRDNGNGITEPGELVSLASQSIEQLSLRYREADQLAAGGNRIAQIASYTRTDGSRGSAVDAILNYTT